MLELLSILFVYLIGGVLAGFLAGLLGIGGGLVIVPFLVMVLPWQGLPEGLVMHVAIASSLAIIIFTSSSSAYAHFKRGSVDWGVVKQLLPGLLIGAVLGSILGGMISGKTLQIIFAFFVIFMALKLGFDLKLNDRVGFPRPAITGCISLSIGMLCAMLGMGGGAFTVPFLRSCQMPMVNAIAISSTTAVPLALAAMLSYAVLGAQHSAVLGWSTGYIYWPAVGMIAMASVATAPWGAKVAHRLPAQRLQQIFAIFLAVVALKMLYSG